MSVENVDVNVLFSYVGEVGLIVTPVKAKFP